MAGYAMYAGCITNFGYNQTFTENPIYEDALK